MSRSDGRTVSPSPTSPCTRAWKANVSFGQGEKPNLSSGTGDLLDEPRQHRVQRLEGLGEHPAGAILLLDLVRDHAHLERGHAGIRGRAQHAVALHRLDVG